MFSGAWLRFLSFALIYILLLLFLRRYAKKIERPLEQVRSEVCFTQNVRMDKGMIGFIGLLVLLLLGLGVGY